MVSTTIRIQYNNGQEVVTDRYPHQSAGTITGTATAANGYNITSITGATIPLQPAYGLIVTLDEFKATKVSNTKWDYSFKIENGDIRNILDYDNMPIQLGVVTEKAAAADPTINLKVTYNNGVETVTDTFNNQKAGTVTGTAKSGTGYTITEVTGAYYRVAGMATNLTNFSATKITDTEYTYSFTLTNDNIADLNRFSKPVRLKVETEEQPTPITIDTSQLVHCSVAPTNINPDDKTTVTLTADPGYILNGNGTYNADGDEKSFTCNNVTSYQLTAVADSSFSISFTAIKLEPSINLKVTYNNGVETVTDTYNNQKAGTVTGTATAGTGYIITSVTGAYYNIVGELTSLKNFNATKISDYKYSYSFDLTNSDIEKLSRFSTPIKLRVETEEQLGNIDINTTNLVHCSILPSTISQGQKTVLTLNADLGYILNGSGSYIVDGKSGSFTCNNVASYQLTITANSSVSITFNATKTEPKPTSIVHTYILSQNDYNNLGKQVIAGTNSSGTAFEQYDYTKFVNYLYQFPFKIGNDITTSTNSINLGKQNLAIDCQKVTRETVDIDLGSIDLTGMSNSHDYKPISITLYCPFSDNIALPATVLNSRLDLSFTCNLKSEQATLLIKQNGNVIYSGQTEVFTDLPLYFTAGIQDTLIKQLKTSYQNTINQAYIVINYNKTITDLTSYKTNEHGLLSNYKGFTRVSHGTLKQSISTSIDKGLLTLLKQGVIIK